MPLNILHLSDIHFKYQLHDTVHDLDHDVRNELAIDAARFRDQSGPIHAVVVTGDIAFAGKPPDYDAATDWLASLCRRIGCRNENVWVVPGNHDIDRSRITPLVRTLQDSLHTAAPHRLDTTIRQVFAEDPTGADVLARPLAAYYDFASQYGCRPKPGTLSWEYALPLDMGYTLRLVGLNSAFVSSERDDKSTRPLLIGQAQLNLPRRPGYIYAILCHHPVSWLKEGDRLDGKLCARASLQLFGHVHEQTLRHSADSLIVQAGALHPDRDTTAPWCPAYNLLSLHIRDSTDGQSLSVAVHPRVWCDEHRFSADPTLAPLQVQHFALMLDDAVRVNHPSPNATVVAETIVGGPRALVATHENNERERDMPNATRQLAYFFLTLPYSTQMRIANALTLLEDDDAGLDCATLFERVYQRARARDGLAALWDHVSTARGDGAMMVNPYRVVGGNEEN